MQKHNIEIQESFDFVIWVYGFRISYFMFLLATDS